MRNSIARSGPSKKTSSLRSCAVGLCVSVASAILSPTPRVFAGDEEPHGLTAVAPLHTLRRAEPSEAHPPSPRLWRVPTSHSSTGLHPWLSAKEGKSSLPIKKGGAIGSALFSLPPEIFRRLALRKSFASRLLRRLRGLPVR